MFWDFCKNFCAAFAACLDIIYDWLGPFANLLPNFPSRGWAAASFLSLVTGLNLALAKFEAFSKSLLDAQGKIETIKKERIDSNEEIKPLLVDDETRCLLECDCDLQVAKAKKIIDSSWTKEHKSAGKYCLIGGTLLFLNVSAGILGLMLLTTLWNTFRAKRLAERTLTEGLIDAVSRHIAQKEVFKNKSSLKAKTIENQLNASLPKIGGKK